MSELYLPPWNRPNWSPLERAISLAELPEETIGFFMWMGPQPGGAQAYKHCDTRNYAYLRGTEDADECRGALAHACSMIDKWAQRPKMSWEHREACGDCGAQYNATDTHETFRARHRCATRSTL
jgi:hypothetical protein